MCSPKDLDGPWVWGPFAQGCMIEHGCPALVGLVTEVEPKPDDESFVTELGG